MSLNKKGYILMFENGTYRIQPITLSSDESIGWYGLLNKKDILLTGMSKSSYKGKPFWSGSGVIAGNLNELPGDLETKVNLIGQRRFWKYLGSRNMGTFETIFIGCAGYGFITVIQSIIETVWGGK